MFNFKRFFTCLILVLILLGSMVLASDSAIDTPLLISENTPVSTPVAQKIDTDLYITNTDSYTLSDIVFGNVFTSANKFVTNPKNNGGIINGNLFAISSEISIQSDVILSDKTDKNGTYLIDKINSKSIINGNVYALSENFILEAGAEIKGDLYVVSQKITIDPNAVIHGSIFLSGENISFAGQIEGSAYIKSDNFDMTYYGYIGRDLYLTSGNVTLDGVVYRDIYVTANQNFTTYSNFKTTNDLYVNYALNTNLSGKVLGNAKINAENLGFQNDNDNILRIYGDLHYAIKNPTEIPEEIVAGEITSSEFEDIKSGRLSIASLSISFLTLLFYIFAVVFFSKLFASKAIEKLPKLSALNVLKSIGIGILSVFVIFVLSVFLILVGVGITFALFLIIAYLFVLGLAVPLFLNKLANTLKFKLNSYVKLLIITAILFLIKLIPVVGSAIVFVLFVAGIGDILLGLFSRKK